MFSVLSAIISTTYLISIIARGYIPEFDNGLKIKATGLLSATSLPKNASVYINDKLYTTTDDTINLIPDDYQLKIVKDGYLPWNKKITIQKEMVYQTQASLFKTNPKLTPATINSVISPTSNQSHNQMVFIATSSSLGTKPGIYLIETSYYLSLLLGNYQPKFITPNPYSSNDKTVTFTFSPNSKQLLLKSSLKRNQYLINLTTNEIGQPSEKINQEWQIQSKQLEFFTLNKLPKIFINTIATNPASISFSSDENKILYLLNNQYQVYDIEKNLNYIIGEKNNIDSPFWLPKSNSIIYTNSHKIKSIEFDGSNDNTIFSQNIDIKTIIYQFDGENLIISTDNIYTLTIK